MKRRNLLKIFIFYPLVLFFTPRKTNAQVNFINLGDKVPDFTIEGYNKNYPSKTNWSLTDFSGKWLVLYFYPKDFTSGCTLEAKGFQQKLKEFSNANASVVGISADNEEEHESFCTSEKLGYTLLSDKNGNISKKYDSWSEPYSKRNTFLINPEGVVVTKWIGVRPLRHAEEVFENLIEREKDYA